jgi:hypothetical protein
VQILRDVTPRLSTIVVASTPANPSTPRRVSAIEAAAARFSLQVSSLSVQSAGDVKLSNGETNTGLIALPSCPDAGG